MNTRNRFIAALALCALAGLFIFQYAGAARAQRGGNELRRLFNVTPPVSIAYGQTFRVNFLNTGGSPLEIVPCIFDADGAHLKTGDRIALQPRQTVSFELSRAEAGGLGDGSVRVRAGVHSDGPVRKNLVVSGEMVDDATGRSTLFVPGLISGFDPQPDPPAAR
jgi:hypothetical protein